MKVKQSTSSLEQQFSFICCSLLGCTEGKQTSCVKSLASRPRHYGTLTAAPETEIGSEGLAEGVLARLVFATLALRHSGTYILACHRGSNPQWGLPSNLYNKMHGSGFPNLSALAEMRNMSVRNNSGFCIAQ